MNKENYKAGIAGVQSQGKTTIIDRLKVSSALADYNFSFLSGVARGVGKYLPINEGGTLLTQYMVMSKHVEACLQPRGAITDRSVLDVMAYTRYHYLKDDIGLAGLSTFETVMYLCLGYYSRIFYIIPELPVVDDGERSAKKQYFDDMVNNFQYYVMDVADRYPGKIIYVRGSVDERVKIIEDQIKIDLN